MKVILKSKDSNGYYNVISNVKTVIDSVFSEYIDVNVVHDGINKCYYINKKDVERIIV